LEVTRKHKHNQLFAACCDCKVNTLTIFSNCKLRSLLISVLPSHSRRFIAPRQPSFNLSRRIQRKSLDFHLAVTLTRSMAQHVGYTWRDRSSWTKDGWKWRQHRRGVQFQVHRYVIPVPKIYPLPTGHA
jgi:hypothetical protein